MVKKTKKSSVAVKKKPNSRKRPLLSVIIVVLVLIVGGFFVYSALSFKNSNYEQHGFITCNPENTVCEESKHIHAEIEVSLCREDIQFPKEKGDTGKQHTHKERNKIHWHARLSLDPETKTYIDDTPRRLTAFFEQMDMTFPTSCPDNPTPQLIVRVNNEERPEGLDYVWQEGDDILVRVE